MSNWFSWDPEYSEFKLHDTAEEAASAAMALLANARERAPEGWPENVTEICWGSLCGSVREAPGSRRPCRDGDPSGVDYMIEYELRGTEP
jgi:hypothetical protein